MQRELETYQRVFGAALADALWSMDKGKLDAIAGGIVAVPEITSLRVTDPANGHVFVSAFNRDGVISISHEAPDGGDPAATPNKPGSSRHGFDLVYHHEAGSSVVGHAEFVSGRQLSAAPDHRPDDADHWHRGAQGSGVVGHFPDRRPAHLKPPADRSVPRDRCDHAREPDTGRSEPRRRARHRRYRTGRHPRLVQCIDRANRTRPRPTRRLSTPASSRTSPSARRNSRRRRSVPKKRENWRRQRTSPKASSSPT